MMPNGKQKLWIISELFPPEETSTGYIMGMIANTMTEKYDVAVICGPEIYDWKKKIDRTKALSISSSVQIYRVEYEISEGGKLSRIWNFILRSWKLYRVSRKKIKEGDKVLMVSNPFPLILFMAFLRRHRNFTLNMLVHDVFPESLYTEMNLHSYAYKLASYFFNKAYSSADLLISLGRDMNEVLAKKCMNFKHNPEMKIIENWGDVINICPWEHVDKEDKIVIQYAGNIGYSQGVDRFVSLLAQANNDIVVFSLWGRGAAEEFIKERVKLLGIQEKVLFNGSYLRSDQNQVLNSCDIALVSLKKGMYGLGVPSKTYNILAAGKPILYIGEENTEIWRLVRDYQIGYCFDPDDNNGIASLISSFSMKSKKELAGMGGRARKLAEERYSENTILNKFKVVI